MSSPAYGTDTYVSATCPTPRRTPLGARGRAGVRRRIGNEYNHMLFNVYIWGFDGGADVATMLPS